MAYDWVGSLEVVIKDGKTNLPVDDIRCVLRDHEPFYMSEVSDSRGIARFDDIPVDIYGDGATSEVYRLNLIETRSPARYKMPNAVTVTIFKDQVFTKGFTLTPVGYRPPECVSGDTRTERCYDGSQIIKYVCQNEMWVRTDKTCPTPPSDGWICVDGETLTSSCLNGTSVVTSRCVNGGWVSTGNKCLEDGGSQPPVFTMGDWILGLTAVGTLLYYYVVKGGKI